MAPRSALRACWTLVALVGGLALPLQADIDHSSPEALLRSTQAVLLQGDRARASGAFHPQQLEIRTWVAEWGYSLGTTQQVLKLEVRADWALALCRHSYEGGYVELAPLRMCRLDERWYLVSTSEEVQPAAPAWIEELQDSWASEELRLAPLPELVPGTPVALSDSVVFHELRVELEASAHLQLRLRVEGAGESGRCFANLRNARGEYLYNRMGAELDFPIYLAAGVYRLACGSEPSSSLAIELLRVPEEALPDNILAWDLEDSQELALEPGAWLELTFETERPRELAFAVTELERPAGEAAHPHIVLSLGQRLRGTELVLGALDAGCHSLRLRNQSREDVQRFRIEAWPLETLRGEMLVPGEAREVKLRSDRPGLVEVDIAERGLYSFNFRPEDRDARLRSFLYRDGRAHSGVLLDGEAWLAPGRYAFVFPHSRRDTRARILLQRRPHLREGEPQAFEVFEEGSFAAGFSLARSRQVRLNVDREAGSRCFVQILQGRAGIAQQALDGSGRLELSLPAGAYEVVVSSQRPTAGELLLSTAAPEALRAPAGARRIAPGDRVRLELEPEVPSDHYLHLDEPAPLLFETSATAQGELQLEVRGLDYPWVSEREIFDPIHILRYLPAGVYRVRLTTEGGAAEAVELGLSAAPLLESGRPLRLPFGPERRSEALVHIEVAGRYWLLCDEPACQFDLLWAHDRQAVREGRDDLERDGYTAIFLPGGGMLRSVQLEAGDYLLDAVSQDGSAGEATFEIRRLGD